MFSDGNFVRILYISSFDSHMEIVHSETVQFLIKSMGNSFFFFAKMQSFLSFLLW